VPTPSGWYPDDSGQQRYWDGQQWTGHTVPPAQSPQSAPGRGGARGVGALTATGRWLHTHPTRRAWCNWLIWSVALLLAIGAMSPKKQTSSKITSAVARSSSPQATLIPPRTSTAPGAPSARTTAHKSPTHSASTTLTPALLSVTNLKDGDSWVASNGKEYRLGLVNAPEYNEPCGPEAKSFTRSFIGSGFTAKAYATDTYGRLVSEIFDPRGRSLNIALAASGLGNDRYLEQYRHENPDLAARLDAAFATAPKPACLESGAPTSQTAPNPLLPPTATPPPASSNCHPDYVTCIPIKGTGSGTGTANDLDCGDIREKVQLRNTNDPYRLDANHDGWGCESYG